MLKLAILAVLACAVQGRDVSEKHCVRLFFYFKKKGWLISASVALNRSVGNLCFACSSVSDYFVAVGKTPVSAHNNPK